MSRFGSSGKGVAALGFAMFISGALADETKFEPDVRLQSVVTEAAHAVMQRNDIPGLSIAITANGQQHYF
ncbi:MAG: hypothetical protein K0S85_4100, partial [Pseudomonas orientalis]|nr:hypothetical protein [Pseudomonas orientalis]